MGKLGKLTKSERFLLICTALFLIGTAVLYLLREPAEYEHFRVQTEREASEAEKAPPLDLNAADAAELEALPGIGPALAQRIVAYREEHGSFASVDELTNVSGIGAQTLERLRAYVTVTP
ncbi:MAG: helix-hairpin-helix domain-containing protein [Oscillospiraceae bacterium]|nr:helix-hairpin-helix domain-containing protein [Oscillospiraceae bacterium]